MANEAKNISEKPKIDEGGPAFPGTLGVPGYGAIPVNLPNGQTGWVDVLPGMTLRDYFAAKALPPILASLDRLGGEAVAACKELGLDPETTSMRDLAATVAYGYADAMLKARAQ